MRVLHVIPSLGPQRGGPSVVARTLAEGLAQAGLEIVVVTTDDNGLERLDVPLCRPVVKNGVTYWYFPRQTRFYTMSWPLAAWLTRHVGDYDLVHIHALFSFASLAAAAVAAQHHVPYIVRPLGTLNHYGMQQRRPWLKTLSLHLLDRHAIRGAAAIHFTSEQERIEAADLRVPHRPVVIPLPVNLHQAMLQSAVGGLRARYPQLVGRTIALFLSRLDPKKGLDLLLPAFAQAHRTNPHLALVIAGSGDTHFVAGLKAHAEALGIGTAVVWAGFVEGETKLEALADADFFVLPSYSENFGIAAVEALAAGLPTILSNQVGIHHEVAAAGAGLTVPCEIAPLSEAINYLGKNTDLCQRMGQTARQFAQSHYSAQAVIGRLVDLYQELVECSFLATSHEGKRI